MTAERDKDRREDHASETKPASERFDDALREVAAEEDETSCDDADAGGFLERFPVAARTGQRPKDED